jgi:hypothetical protein
MMGIHDVFLPDATNSNNPILERRLIKDAGRYCTQKRYSASTLMARQRQCGLSQLRGRSSSPSSRAGYGWVRGAQPVYHSKNLNWSWQNSGMHSRVYQQEWVCYHHVIGSSNSTQPLCIYIQTAKYSMQLRAVVISPMQINIGTHAMSQANVWVARLYWDRGCIQLCIGGVVFGELSACTPTVFR